MDTSVSNTDIPESKTVAKKRFGSPRPSNMESVNTERKRQLSPEPQAEEETKLGEKTRSLLSAAMPSTEDTKELLQQVADHEDTRKAASTKGSTLRAMFSLPSNERYIDDFNCALQKTILLQGRLYLFQHYVCFHSNVFGFIKVKVISLKDVTRVRKAKTALVVPNAVEITVFGKREFFTSFLSPDKAYKKIVEAWSQCSRYAKLYLGRHSRSAKGGAALHAPLQPETRAGGRTHEGEFLLSSDDDDEDEEDQEDEEDEEEEEAAAVARLGSLDGSMEESHAEEEGEGEELEMDEDEDDQDATEDIQMLLRSRPPECWQLLVQAELDCTVKVFFQLFWADDSHFFDKFLASTGQDCQKVKVLKWTAHPHFGQARDVTFLSPIRGSKFGPKTTNCHQTQCYRFRNHGTTLTIETSQVMTDIPYSDYFRVEMRWEVKPFTAGSQPACQVSIMMDVPFCKKTVWQSRIEQNARAECHRQFQAYMEFAREELQRIERQTPGAGGPTHHSPKDAAHQDLNFENSKFTPENVPEEWRETIQEMLEGKKPPQNSKKNLKSSSTKFTSGTSTNDSPRDQSFWSLNAFVRRQGLLTVLVMLILIFQGIIAFQLRTVISINVQLQQCKAAKQWNQQDGSFEASYWKSKIHSAKEEMHSLEDRMVILQRQLSFMSDVFEASPHDGIKEHIDEDSTSSEEISDFIPNKIDM